MSRPNKLWFWKARGQYAITINGIRHTLGTDRDEAEKKFARLVLEKDSNTEPVNTLRSIFDAFLEWAEKERPDSFSWYQRYIKSFWQSLPAGFTIDQLKPYHVEQWASQAGGKRGRIVCIKRSLNWAIEQGYIDRSPVASLHLPALGKTDKILTKKEFEALLKVTDPNFRRLLRFSWLTGSRPQESTIVTAEQLDTKNSRIVIQRSSAKGKKKVRVIYLCKEALRLVSGIQQGYLFTNSRGTRWTAGVVKTKFSRLEPKVGRRYTLYMFRHSFCHHGLKKGVDPITMAVLMGHSKPSMVADVYSHLSQDPPYLLKSVNTLFPAEPKPSSASRSPDDTKKRKRSSPPRKS